MGREFALNAFHRMEENVPFTVVRSWKVIHTILRGRGQCPSIYILVAWLMITCFNISVVLHFVVLHCSVYS